ISPTPAEIHLRPKFIAPAESFWLSLSWWDISVRAPVLRARNNIGLLTDWQRHFGNLISIFPPSFVWAATPKIARWPFCNERRGCLAHRSRVIARPTRRPRLQGALPNSSRPAREQNGNRARRACQSSLGIHRSQRFR